MKNKRQPNAHSPTDFSLTFNSELIITLRSRTFRLGHKRSKQEYVCGFAHRSSSVHLCSGMLCFRCTKDTSSTAFQPGYFVPTESTSQPALRPPNTIRSGVPTRRLNHFSHTPLSSSDSALPTIRRLFNERLRDIVPQGEKYPVVDLYPAQHYSEAYMNELWEQLELNGRLFFKMEGSPINPEARLYASIVERTPLAEMTFGKLQRHKVRWAILEVLPGSSSEMPKPTSPRVNVLTYLETRRLSFSRAEQLVRTNVASGKMIQLRDVLRRIP
ncbi:uncharacterized protein UTRI_06218 [Ustilago trichophora]|uniref:Uncharacterized protein n=1 Tax=Ustilago trichophora TaxID=86804 RepID=A0A5C3EJ63_9BASI|nr:uncharacterized protein UTRI_06218 [Ustilago trichophora]